MDKQFHQLFMVQLPKGPLIVQTANQFHDILFPANLYIPGDQLIQNIVENLKFSTFSPAGCRIRNHTVLALLLHFPEITGFTPLRSFSACLPDPVCFFYREQPDRLEYLFKIFHFLLCLSGCHLFVYCHICPAFTCAGSLKIPLICVNYYIYDNISQRK